MDFAEFFEQTAPGLVRLCCLTTLDREAAADAAQEALSRAWRDWPRIGDDSSDPSAWTTTVALNLCRNRWRRLTSQARLAPRANRTDHRSDELPDIDLQRALRACPCASARLWSSTTGPTSASTPVRPPWVSRSVP